MTLLILEPSYRRPLNMVCLENHVSRSISCTRVHGDQTWRVILGWEVLLLPLWFFSWFLLVGKAKLQHCSSNVSARSFSIIQKRSLSWWPHINIQASREPAPTSDEEIVPLFLNVWNMIIFFAPETFFIVFFCCTSQEDKLIQKKLNKSWCCSFPAGICVSVSVTACNSEDYRAGSEHSRQKSCTRCSLHPDEAPRQRRWEVDILEIFPPQKKISKDFLQSCDLHYCEQFQKFCQKPSVLGSSVILILPSAITPNMCSDSWISINQR